MEENNLNTWQEFECLLGNIRTAQESSAAERNSPLLFRGQENSSWPLTTTLDRLRKRMRFTDYYGIITKAKPQIESLTGAEWPIPEYPQIAKDAANYESFSLWLWSGRCPGYAFMVYLRHHGFPSPLLDWTRSPYIAAYFAFSKAHDVSARVSIYVLAERAGRPSGNQMPVLDRYGPFVKTHRRHVLQQCEYTLCTNFEDAFRFEVYDKVFDAGLHQQAFCRKITLPATERRNVLNILDSYNLNAFSLFESEEGMMDMLILRKPLLSQSNSDRNSQAASHPAGQK